MSWQERRHYFPVGYFLVCLVMRCWTSTKPAPIGVSQDCEDIPDGTTCRAAWAVGSESANHTGLSGFAIGHLESNFVPPYSVCEEKKGVSAAIADSSLLASDRTRLTSGDQCSGATTAGYSGSVSTLTCIFEVVTGSGSLIGSLPNCLSAVDGFPSVVNQGCGRIAFPESCYSHCSDGHAPVDVTTSTWSWRSNAFLSGTLRHFIPLTKFCLARVWRFSKTTLWRAWIALLCPG